MQITWCFVCFFRRTTRFSTFCVKIVLKNVLKKRDHCSVLDVLFCIKSVLTEPTTRNMIYTLKIDRTFE